MDGSYGEAVVGSPEPTGAWVEAGSTGGSVIGGDGICPSDKSAVASGGCSVEDEDEENHSLIFEPIDERSEGSVAAACDSDDGPST